MADKKQDSGQWWEWAIEHARQRRGLPRIFYDNYKVTLGQEITLNRDLSLLENSFQPSELKLGDNFHMHIAHCDEPTSLVIITYCTITFNICVGLEGWVR